MQKEDSIATSETQRIGSADINVSGGEDLPNNHENQTISIATPASPTTDSSNVSSNESNPFVGIAESAAGEKKVNAIYFSSNGEAEVVMASEAQQTTSDLKIRTGDSKLPSDETINTHDQTTPAISEISSGVSVSSRNQISDQTAPKSADPVPLESQTFSPLELATGIPENVSFKTPLPSPTAETATLQAEDVHVAPQPETESTSENGISGAAATEKNDASTPKEEATVKASKGISEPSLLKEVNAELSQDETGKELTKTIGSDSNALDLHALSQGALVSEAIITDTEREEKKESSNAKEESLPIIYDEENEKKANEKKFANESKNKRNLFHHLSVFSASALGVFLLGMTLFIGGSLEEAFSHPNNGLRSSGRNSVTLESGEQFYVKGLFSLFGGEHIEALNHDTELFFYDGSTVRMKKDAVITIDVLYPSPVINLEHGEIWVMGNKNLEVLFNKARFETRATSAYFHKDGDKITAATFRHPLFVELWEKEPGKHIFFAIPKEKKVVFYENSLPKTIADLHFSKLKKEIRFSDAEKDSWVAQNLIEDNTIITKAIEEAKMQKKNSYLGENMLAMIQKSVIVFPRKRQEKETENYVDKQKSYLAEIAGNGSSFLLTPGELSNDTLESAAIFSNNLMPSKQVLDMAVAYHQEIEKRDLSGQPDYLIAHNLLSFFEDALSSGNIEQTSAVLEVMTKRWEKKKNTPENRNLLEVYREVIADLSRRYLHIITPEILVASGKLDSIAISWENQQMAVITTLEVTEKNLATADTYLEKTKLPMAKVLLDINDSLLNIKPPTNLIAGYESIRSRQAFLKEKYEIFKSNGWMSKEDLFTLLAKRENAEKIILYVQEEKNRLARLSAPVETEKTLDQTVRDAFSLNKIQIVSMIGTDTKDAKSVEIIEARLPNGDIFSGEYFPDYEVIRNVKLDDGNKIANDVLLSKLIPTIEALRSNQYLSSGEDLRELRTNPIPELEEDPLEKMDTLDIEVMKLLAQASLAEKSIVANLKDISIKSTQVVHLTNVTFDEIKGHSLEFDYNTETRTVSNGVLLPEGMPVNAKTLDQLIDASLEAIMQYESNLELVNQVKWVLINAGIAVGEKEIRFTQAGVHFENGKYYNWNLSGLADLDSQKFIMIKKNGKPYLNNIAFDDLKSQIDIDRFEEEKSKQDL